MLKSTLLRNATATDGGGSVATQQVNGSGNAPSGTITIGGDDSDSGDTTTDGGDADSIGGDDATNDEEVKSPIKEKIPVKKKVGEVKVTVKDKPDDLTGEIPDVDELNEFPTKKQDDKEKELEAAANKQKEQQQQQQQQQQNKQQQNASQRDYSIFSPEVAEQLKKAPNQVFDLVKREALAKKELEVKLTDTTKKLEEASKGIVKLPDNYIEHPQAYVFDPQYSKIRASKSLAEKQADHYMNQLARIESGEPWQDITGLDEQGNFTFQEYQEATIQEKEQIRQKILELRGEAKQADQLINNLRVQHVTKHKALTGAIDAKLKEHCPWLKDDKMFTETKIPYWNGKEMVDMSLKEIGEYSEKQLAAVGSNVLVPVVKNLQIALAISNAKVMAFESQKQVTQQIQQDKSTAEPNVNSKGRGLAAKKDDKSIPTLTDMDE